MIGPVYAHVGEEFGGGSGTGYGMMHQFGEMMGWMGFGSVLGLLTWLLFVTLLVLGIVYLWQKIQDGQTGNGSRETPPDQ
jgi:preprotein translocase subunit SecG